MNALLRTACAAALVLGLLGCPGPTIFFIFPIPLSEAGEITGLGNLNPRSRHTLPINHMHINFPDSDLTAASPPRHTLSAPADGTIFLLTFDKGANGYQYTIYVKYSDTIVYLIDHMTEIAPWLQAEVDLRGWHTFSTTSFYPKFFAGETPGYPAGIAVTAGTVLGSVSAVIDGLTGQPVVRAWDFGVIDQGVSRFFDASTTFHYPRFQDLAAVLGLTFDWPFLGNPFVSAGAFPDYYGGALRTSILAKVSCVSPLHDVGSDSWDVAGRLRGGWFNPAVDVGPGPLLNFECGALVIAPYQRDQRQYAVSVGNDDGSSLALLDPVPHPPEFGNIFSGVMTASATVNPDPATVGVGTTVAYDLPYTTPTSSGSHTLLCAMTGPRECWFRVVLHPSGSPPSAAADLAASPAPDPTWIRYIR